MDAQPKVVLNLVGLERIQAFPQAQADLAEIVELSPSAVIRL
jgi:hypothetical protein